MSDELIRLSERLISQNRLNGAEEILFDVTDTEQENHHAYFLLGQVMEKKSNFSAAHQMYNVAVMLRPDLREYGAKLEHVSTLLETKGAAVPTAREHVRENRKFDFLFVPLARGGSRALQFYLSTHPEVYVPRRRELDRALEHNHDQVFLSRNQPMMTETGAQVTGLVQHGFLGLETNSPIPERLANLVRTDKFVLSVRDPISACRAMYNHQLYASTSNYSFEKCGIEWFPSGIDLFKLARGEWKPAGGRPAALEHEFGLNHLQVNLNGSLHYHKVEQNYLRHFGSCEAFDILQLMKTCRDSLPSLYAMVGASSDFWHPLFGTRMSNPPQITMEYNPILASIQGEQVRLVMSYQGFADAIPGHRDIVELAELQPDARFKEAGLESHSIVLGADTRDWTMVDRGVRLKLTSGELFERVLADVVFPNWLVCFDQFRQLYSSHRWDQDSPGQFKDTILKFLGNEPKLFLKSHPHLEQYWPNAAEYS